MTRAVHDPGPLLDLADGLLRRADPATAGMWPRAASLLGRRALEVSLERLWRERDAGLESCPMRTQLICLRRYLEDRGLATRAGHAWSALSRACHHHPYELAPTAAELRGWFAVVRELAQSVDSRSGRA